MQSILSNPLLLAIIALSIATIILLVIVTQMHFRLKKFLVVVDAQNIGDSLASVSDDLKNLKEFRNELEAYILTVEKRLKKSVQSVHTVRFNPFKGVGAGGNQSFATAFLNEEGDGVIISSLYSRDHVSVFSKPIKDSSSEHELSDEESEALNSAKAKLK